MKGILLGLSLLFTLNGVSLAAKHVLCYHGTWATYRHSNGKFNVDNIDPMLCTHLIYSFFGITQDGRIRIIDPYLDLEENWGRGNIKKFNALKNINSNLKTLAAVGGWNEKSYNFSIVANDPAKRAVFAEDAANFVMQYGFDGMDFDWEYPGQRDGNPQTDKQAFTILLREVKERFSRDNLLLTAAVASAEFSASQSYDITEIVKYLDIINVMTYDFHGAWDETIGINAPLYSGPSDTSSIQQQLNANSSISYWLSQGAPKEKLIMGIAFYGRTFALRNNAHTEPGALHSGPGLGGQYSSEPGNIGYNELCEKQLTQRWTRAWEDTQKSPYAYLGNQWIGYDDIESITLKAEYIMSLDLGGAMVWSIESDDFLGLCGNGKYPLLRTLNSILRGDVPLPPSTTTGTAPPTITTPTSTTSGGSNTECTASGVFPDPNNCDSFFVCANNQQTQFKCPGGLLFDPEIKSCNWPHMVDCKQ